MAEVSLKFQRGDVSTDVLDKRIMEIDQLIAALASPPGSGERGIVRLSGIDVQAQIDRAFVARSTSCSNGFAGQRAGRQCGVWRLSDSPAFIPCDLYSWPTARSYTGQPVAELHLPGSPPILEQVLHDLFRHGVRAARPGEFTLRAFLAGKIDLVQAEAVLGVIDAGDEGELKLALQQLAGGISGRLLQLQGELLDLLADLEAGLDFVDEGLEFVSREELVARVRAARQFVDSLGRQSAARMTSGSVPTVVLAGAPNAGKSTLFNALSGKSLALVSPAQGTTRDYLRAGVVWNDVALELIDTAGWEPVVAGLSGAAQAQRADQLQRAALVVWCTAADSADPNPAPDALAEFSAIPTNLPRLSVLTKCDLLDSRASPVDVGQSDGWSCRVSAHSGLGCADLKSSITALLTGSQSRDLPWLGITAARCQHSLERATAALHRAEQAGQPPYLGDELLAIDLRDALDHLGTVIGTVYTDDILDRIFSKFCIGK